MLEITRERAIRRLVDHELETIDLDELVGMYADTVVNGAMGYNEFTDADLATQYEFTFNEIGGVRIIPTEK